MIFAILNSPDSYREKDLPPLPFLRCFALLSMTTAILCCSSCRQKPDYSGEMSRLDSTYQALDSAAAKFRTHAPADSAAIAAGSKKIAESIREIKSLFPSDTVNKELAMFLYQLSDLKGSLDLADANGRYYSRSIDSSRKQIMNLKTDLNNGLIDKNKAEEYVVNEINTAKKIIEGMNNTTFQSREDFRKLDSLLPRIIMITDSLRSE